MLVRAISFGTALYPDTEQISTVTGPMPCENDADDLMSMLVIFYSFRYPIFRSHLDSGASPVTWVVGSLSIVTLQVLLQTQAGFAQWASEQWLPHRALAR